MPESLQKPPHLKPELDPSARSWIQIAVGQRAPKDVRSQADSSSPGQNGSTAQGSSKQGRQPQSNQATPGSPGSGFAQVLSVDEERLVDDRVRKPAQSSGNGNGVASSDSSGSGSKQKQAGGVSLFGSYKAPIKRE